MMAQGWNVAVLGACGAVGEALVELLQERQFPLGQLYLLSRGEDTAKSRRVAGKTYSVSSAADFDWQQAQLVFFVAGQQASADYIQAATSAGCLIIDNSGLFMHLADVPLVVPQINDAALLDYRNRNIVAVAGSATCQLLLALQPLLQQSPLVAVQVCTLLAASAHSTAAVEALARQSVTLLNGQGIDDSAPFAAQLAFNTLPLLPDEVGSVAQERRLVNEVRRILQYSSLQAVDLQNSLPVSSAFIQAPVFYGQGQMVSVTLQQPLSADQGRQIWADCQHITLLPANELPNQVMHGAQSSNLTIGCVRENYGLQETAQSNSLQFWSVVDNVRFSGALMAVQVAERLIQVVSES